MTEFNQNPMNTQPRSKAPLALFIVCILVLAIVGIYFAYARSFQVGGQINSIQNITQQSDNNQTNSAINDDGTEHQLSDCGIIFQAPTNWQLQKVTNIGDTESTNVIYSITSPEMISALKKTEEESEATYEGMVNDFIIKCYSTLKKLTQKSWDLNKKNNPNFSDPKDLFDALTRKNTVGVIYSSVDPYPIMQVIDIQQVEIGGKEAFAGYVFGTPGTVLTYYFQNESTGKIISFESEENEYPKITLKQPHSNIIKNFRWIN